MVFFFFKREKGGEDEKCSFLVCFFKFYLIFFNSFYGGSLLTWPRVLINVFERMEEEDDE